MEKETVIGFFLGALAGAIGAAVWTGKRFEKQIAENNQEWEDYVDSLVDEMSDKCAECQQNFEFEEDQEFEECDAEDYDREALVEFLNQSATSDKTKEELEEMRDENGVIPYDKFSKKKNQEEPEEAAVEEPEPERVQDDYLEEDEMDELTIHYITKDEYETEDEFDKVELTYLDGSDVFISEEMEKYNAYPAIGGRDTLEDGFSESADGYVYVRNDALEMDFCIVSDVRTYDEFMEETSEG